MEVGLIELVIIGLLCIVPLAIGIVVAVVLITRNQIPTNPDLIPCPECGRQLSPQATTCPHCGCPLNEPPPMEQNA